ncbi:ABC transporter ATP-binding protein [Marispirochaeta aestuarii]|uniref:ABC transporter ATP-binding protein n=1 Tax=Marispirochaeta aestuarii TaxID=1963862 RepID=A0A1Y1RYR3_9SPIO|nr:ATP-binding cassette domain-containing protein [Marispirochaeta aestuarii]ORC35682.1 ABC transporter ATP-binding protein [Marispirochaeta aestuarii]
MKNEDTILEVRGLKKAFKGQVVLDGVDVTFPRKRITAIFGQSGTGKSVLMKNLIGILDPDEGEILIDGQDVVGMSPDEKRKIRRRLGYLFQDAALFDSMNVGENIAFPLVEVLNIRDKLKIRRRVSELLEWVQLPGIESKMPGELSGGMRKRVGLARSLASEPEIMLFDEPTTGLDPILSDNVHKLIERVNRELGMTCIVITHDIAGSFGMADKIAFLHEGRVLAQGEPESMRCVDHPVLQRFFEFSFGSEDSEAAKGEENE